MISAKMFEHSLELIKFITISTVAYIKKCTDH